MREFRLVKSRATFKTCVKQTDEKLSVGDNDRARRSGRQGTKPKLTDEPESRAKFTRLALTGLSIHTIIIV
jgi:hypothetical protein